MAANASGGGSGILPKNVPACLKSVKPYISRGAELEAMALRSPESAGYQRRASYYCYLYALELGMEKMKSLEEDSQTSEAERYLLSVMDAVEKEKERLGIKDSDKKEDAEIIKSNALRAFKNADNQLREQNADSKTARGFYVAANFFDILGGMECDNSIPNFEEMRKYAKYYALHITESVKAGTAPTPPDGTNFETAEPGDDDVSMGVADGGESKDQGGFGASSNFAFQSSSGVSAPPPDDDYQSFGNKHMPSNDGHYQRDHKIQKSEPPRDSNGESRFQDRQQQSSFSNFLKKRDQQPALFEEESAVLSTSVKFHDNDLHDAWEYSRFALRAMETGDKKTAKEYLHKSLELL